MRIRITPKKLKRSLVQAFTLLLLILYVIGTSQSELLHAFVHDHEVMVAHSAEQELDPCHRLIYHHDVSQGCKHDSHLVVSDKCQMCDLVYHGDQNNLMLVSLATVECLSTHFDFYKSNLDSHQAVISSSRAPPVRS